MKKIYILRNKRLPPIPVRFAGVKKAINDIDVLFKENISEFENTGHLRTGIRTCLNSAMYGANAELSYPGRAGEMLDLNPDAIKDVLADEKNGGMRLKITKPKMYMVESAESFQRF